MSPLFIILQYFVIKTKTRTEEFRTTGKGSFTQCTNTYNRTLQTNCPILAQGKSFLLVCLLQIKCQTVVIAKLSLLLLCINFKVAYY